MRLTLGRDVGVVMMKGVILGVLCVVLVLPSILLVLDQPIQKYTHKALNPNFEPMNRFLVKHRWVFFGGGPGGGPAGYLSPGPHRCVPRPDGQYDPGDLLQPGGHQKSWKRTMIW